MLTYPGSQRHRETFQNIQLSQHRSHARHGQCDAVREDDAPARRRVSRGGQRELDGLRADGNGASRLRSFVSLSLRLSPKPHLPRSLSLSLSLRARRTRSLVPRVS